MSINLGSSSSSTRSSSPELPAQPDHFYGNEDIQLPPSPSSDHRNRLDPADDPAAQRGIPVFKPTLDEFLNFEAYMHKVEPWGMRSGIVKVIPPKEWSDRLPSIIPQLNNVKLKNPIEQHMVGHSGLFQQQNIEKRRVLSVREWAELCARDDLRAPGVDEVGLHARAQNGSARLRMRRGPNAHASENANVNKNANRDARGSETAEPDTPINIKSEIDQELLPFDHPDPASVLISPPNSNRTLSPVDEAAQHQAADPSQPPKPRHPMAQEEEEEVEEVEVKRSINVQPEEHVEPKQVVKPGENFKLAEVSKLRRGRRPAVPPKSKEAQLAERAEKDRGFLESFDPDTAWLPPNTTASSYTPEFCKELERKYWRNCGFGKAPWYGADMQGSLFTDETTAWNVACLPSTLSRLLPASSKGLPGVNTPYLYFGMWRATFAWHVEDMDLFSINYIHFGAPKFWYAMPQVRANALEQTMRSSFPGAGKHCSQFLRHKSYLVSPMVLSKSSCRPNHLVQQAGEFVITYPRGYHAGFNLGFNCAESVNFALDSWIDLGRKAKVCECVDFSVRIDVDRLLYDRAVEHQEVFYHPRKGNKDTENELALDEDVRLTVIRKRKLDGGLPSKTKRQKTKPPSARASEQPVASSSKLPAQTVPKIKITFKLPPRPKPKEPDTFPCCLCASMSREGLLHVQDPPAWWYESGNTEAAAGPCMAHIQCACVVPETWVDEIEVGEPDEGGVRRKEKVVFGVDAIVKDRWNLKCTACTKLNTRMHGAPIQCTKGKCPKAFHVSCAREGHASGIVYRELREVEKEVVLFDPPLHIQPQQSDSVTQALPVNAQPSSLSVDAVLIGQQRMDIDSAVAGADPCAFSLPQDSRLVVSPQVLKTIKKTEVELLCHQHNPDVLAAKKQQQQDRIRDALAALPPESRIKLRVTAGVFEVTLVRIIEESCSVEVVWDRGLKREFKWRSVVFNDTEVIGQKPTEVAPELPVPPVPPRTSYSAAFRPSPPVPLTAASSAISHSPTYVSPPSTASSSTGPVYPQQSSANSYQPYPYQSTTAYQYAPGSWTHQYPPSPSTSHPQYPQTQPSTSTSLYTTSYGQPHAGYYSPYSGATSYRGYGNYPPPSQPDSHTQTQGQLQWQRPYTGPLSKPTIVSPVLPYHGYPNPPTAAIASPSQSQVSSRTPSLLPVTSSVSVAASGNTTSVQSATSPMDVGASSPLV